MQPLQQRYQLAYRLYPYQKHADQTADVPAHYPVIIVGAGPVGLSLALDLGLKGHAVVVLDDHEGVGEGSRAICFAKRTLEIAHRLGVGEQLVSKGIIWQKGRVFHDRDEIYQFDLLEEKGHRCPAFINLSQQHVEKYFVERIRTANQDGAQIDIRGQNRVDALQQDQDGVTLDIMTPDGSYQLKGTYVVACDGANSPVRNMMGLGFEGRVFEDNFLIADVKMKADFPTERWFWFEPWFKSGASALLHKQPDDIWRIDFQLGWDIDRKKELEPANIRARVDAMLGPEIDYELDWCSIYTFQCRRMEKFVEDRVIFAGDSAHQVSPFGARGANSGIQDSDNLGWKLDLILRGLARRDLLKSYEQERVFAADENIKNSTRSTDFLTPKSDTSKLFRDAVLDLAATYAFARPLVNSGRLSLPSHFEGFDRFCADHFEGPIVSKPGSPCPDVPFEEGFLLDRLMGEFTLLAINCEVPEKLQFEHIDLVHLAIDGDRVNHFIEQRYLGEASSALYLIRPDQHIVARWGEFDKALVAQALKKAIAH